MAQDVTVLRADANDSLPLGCSMLALCQCTVNILLSLSLLVLHSTICTSFTLILFLHFIRHCVMYMLYYDCRRDILAHTS